MDETEEHVCACVRVRALLEDVKLGGKATGVPHQNHHRPALLQHTTAKSKTVTCSNQSEHFNVYIPHFGGGVWKFVIKLKHSHHTHKHQTAMEGVEEVYSVKRCGEVVLGYFSVQHSTFTEPS